MMRQLLALVAVCVCSSRILAASDTCVTPGSCHGNERSMGSMLLQTPDGRPLARVVIPNDAAGAYEHAESLARRELPPRFQKFVAQHSAQMLSVCQAKPLCEKCMLDPGALVQEEVTKLAGCLLDHVSDKTKGENAVEGSKSLLQVDRGIGNEVGTGVVGNMATAGVSMGVGLVFTGLAKTGPAGESLAEAGQSISCVFGMGCPDPNEDIGSMVEEQTNRVIDRMGEIKEELKEDIAGVKTAVIDARDRVLKGMTNMGQKISEQMDKGLGEVSDVVTQESQKVLESVEAVATLVESNSEASTDLALKHHYEDLERKCREYQITVQVNYRGWQSILQEIQRGLNEAFLLSLADEVAAENKFMELKQIHDKFWTQSMYSKYSLRRDTALLFECVAGDDNLFQRLADRLSSESFLPDRMEAMRAVITDYLGSLGQADAIYYASLMYEQFYVRKTRSMAEASVSMAAVLIERGKLFKAFWDAWYSDSIMGSCPICIAKGFTYDMGERVCPNERDGDDCQKVDTYVSKHDALKLELGPQASRYARDLGQHAPSDGSTICKIYSVAAHPHGPNCWSWGGARALTAWYTDHSMFDSQKTCTGSYPR